MRTAGLTMNNVWAHRVLREQGIETHRTEGVEADITVLVESLELKHRGPEEKYRPYLHLSGELLSIKPLQELPYGIDELTYTLGKSDLVNAFYEFDEQQLIELTRKGYFSRQFEVPDDLKGMDWELPATVDLLLLMPEKTEGSQPVVFAKVHDIGNLEISKENSGYNMAPFFADFSAETTLDDQEEVTTRKDEVDPLFTEEELSLDGARAHHGEHSPAATREEHTAAQNGLDVADQLERVEADIDAAEQEFHDSLEEADDELVQVLETEDHAAAKEDEHLTAVLGELFDVSASAQDGGEDFDAWAASAPSAPSPEPEVDDLGELNTADGDSSAVSSEQEEVYLDLGLGGDDAAEIPGVPETLEADTGEESTSLLDDPTDDAPLVDIGDVEQSGDEPAGEELTSEQEEQEERLERARALHQRQSLRAGRRAARSAPVSVQERKRRLEESTVSSEHDDEVEDRDFSA